MIYYAALTQVDLEVACELLARTLSLSQFQIDVEFEGRDRWEHAESKDARVSLNLTKILEFDRPEFWSWMWGAPDKANTQIILSGDKSGSSEVHRFIAEALECKLEPYPTGFEFNPSWKQ